MYLSIRDDMVFAAGYERLADGLHDLAIGSVELFVQRDGTVPALAPTDDKMRLCVGNARELQTLQAQAARADITICALCMGNNFNADDKEAEIIRGVETVQAAQFLHAPVVRMDPIMSGEAHLPLEERQRIVAAALTRILDDTAGTGIDIGLENHGLQGNDPDFLTGILLLVNSPRLGLTLDSGNFYWRGWPLSRLYTIFEQFAPVVKHTHIKNIGYPPEIRETQREMGYEYNRYACPIHEGDIDHARYIATLKAAGYDRDICLEDESLGRYPLEQRKANLRDAADFFRPLL